MGTEINRDVAAAPNMPSGIEGVGFVATGNTVVVEPGSLDIEAYIPELVLDEFGSLPDTYMMRDFGMTSIEGRQEVEFGKWKGTVAQMLNDPGCPVGAVIRTAHREGGVEGVKKAFEGFKMIDPKININVDPKTYKDYEKHGLQDPKNSIAAANEKVVPSKVTEQKAAQEPEKKK